MYIRKSSWMAGALVSVLALGCASDQSGAKTPDDQSFSQLRQEELESERREFVSDRRQQLEEMDTQINRLEARLEHEGKFVDAEEKAEWSQELFELRQQHRQARAELDRAENASPEEWAEMRSTAGYAIDTLQAGVNSITNDISGLFAGDEDEVRAVKGVDELGVDLCEMADDGVSATVMEQGNDLVVRFTAADPGDVDDLREEAREVSRRALSTSARESDTSSDSRAVAPGGRETGDQSSTSSQRRATGGGSTDTAPGERPTGDTRRPAMIDDIRVDNIENGVSVIFEPAQGQRAALREQLENEVERIQRQDCD